MYITSNCSTLRKRIVPDIKSFSLSVINSSINILFGATFSLLFNQLFKLVFNPIVYLFIEGEIIVLTSFFTFFVRAIISFQLMAAQPEHVWAWCLGKK